MGKMDRVAVVLLTMPGIFAVIRLALILIHEPWWLQVLQHLPGKLG